MQRRNFLKALFGGFAATALIPKLAEAAPSAPMPPAPADLPETLEVAVDDRQALEEADKAYSQFYVRRRVYRRRVVYVRPRRRVVYVRPVRRVYYRRPVRRRVIRVF
jgi:hypothetical protein